MQKINALREILASFRRRAKNKPSGGGMKRQWMKWSQNKERSSTQGIDPKLKTIYPAVASPSSSSSNPRHVTPKPWRRRTNLGLKLSPSTPDPFPFLSFFALFRDDFFTSFRPPKLETNFCPWNRDVGLNLPLSAFRAPSSASG
jgi:hypothetical protein